MIISIVGRAVIAATGKDWEAVGIVPTVETPPTQAFDVAMVRALQIAAPRARAQDAAAPSPRPLMRQINPVKTELPFDAYAGVYGDRTVKAGDKGLTIRRGEGPVSPLIAVGPNRFAYASDPASTVTFAVSAGKSNALHLVRGDGSEDHGERSN